MQSILTTYCILTKSLITFLSGIFSHSIVVIFRNLSFYVIGVMMWLIWWYVELERRLLVARHHLQDRISLEFRIDHFNLNNFPI